MNSSGDHWREAVAGLEAIGFRERLAVLREAVALFGKEGPSTDRSMRQNQLSQIHRRNETAFEELDSRYYKSTEAIEVLTSRFVMANAESFR